MSYVRKVKCREEFHHANGDTFNNGTADFLRGSVPQQWTMTYDSTTGGSVAGPNIASEVYLTNHDNQVYGIENQMMFEIGIEASSIAHSATTGMGMIFMADAMGGTWTNCYRLRQTATTLYIEKSGDSGANWTTIGSDSIAGAPNTVTHYRVIYCPQTLDFYGISGSLVQGYFAVYSSIDRELVHDNLVLTCTDSSSPLTAGGYMGVYSGVSANIDCYYFGAYRLWELNVARVKYEHEINETSLAEVTFERNPDRIQPYWSEADVVEIWNREEDRENSYTRLRRVFHGQVEVIPVANKTAQINLVGMMDELKRQQVQAGSAYTGTIESTIQNILPEDGSNQGLMGGTTTHYLHRLNISITSQNTNRYFQGATGDIELLKILAEDGDFMFYHPDGRFFIRKTLVDDSLELDGTSYYNNIISINYLNDLTQVFNDVDVYYNGWSASPSSSTDATSRSAFGQRARVISDMNGLSSTIAGNVGTETLDSTKTSPRIIEIGIAQQHFNIFPGYMVSCILPGTDVGTNATAGLPDPDTGNWVAEDCTVVKVTYDSAASDTGNHKIYVVKNNQAAGTTPIIRKIGDLGSIDKTTRNLYAQDV